MVCVRVRQEETLLNSRERSVVAMVLMFTASAVLLLWGVTLRWQAELRTQVTDRAEQTSAQLADALAGQVLADLALMDHFLLSLRSRSGGDPAQIKDMALKELEVLPRGLVSHMTLADAQGKVLFTGREGKPAPKFDLTGQPQFRVMQTQADQLVVGEPVTSWSQPGQWLLPVGRPLYRNGQFDGALYLMVSTEYLAQSLGRLTLAADDVITLLHPSGRYLVRSHENGRAAAQSAVMQTWSRCSCCTSACTPGAPCASTAPSLRI